MKTFALATLAAAASARFHNLGLINDTVRAGEMLVDYAVDKAEEIHDTYDCPDAQVTSYCTQKAKNYGVFTGVNGNVFERCVADICLERATAGYVPYAAPEPVDEDLYQGIIASSTETLIEINDACATTEEQAFCLKKSKDYGVFTGVNGNVYKRCISDICLAKYSATDDYQGIIATGTKAAIEVNDACATTEQQAYCLKKSKDYGVFTGVNGNIYGSCIIDMCYENMAGTTMNMVYGTYGPTGVSIE